MPALSPTLLPSTGPTMTLSEATDTTLGKTFSNSQYGISFNYPNSGTVDPTAAGYDNAISFSVTQSIPLLHIAIQNSRDALMQGALLQEQNLDKYYQLLFYVYDNPQNISIDQIANHRVSGGGITAGFTKTGDIPVGGVTGVIGKWVSGDVGSYKAVAVNHNGKTYIFEMTNDNGEVSLAGEQLLDKILPTVQFKK